MIESNAKKGSGWLGMSRKTGDRVTLSFERDGQWVVIKVDFNFIDRNEVRLAINAPRSVRVARVDRKDIDTNGI